MARPQLLDAYGRPIQTAKLKSEQANADVLAVRRPDALHPASGLTPGRLANILRDSIEGDPENYLALAEDMEERNEHYAGVLGIRKRQVAGLEITVEAAGDDARSIEHADLVREAFARPGVKAELIDILDAVGKSYSGTEIVWDTSEGDWRIKRLEWKDPRHFRYSTDDGTTPLLRVQGGDERLNPFQWIWHEAKVKSGLPVRGGLARAAAWTFFFKSFSLKDWAIFCEAYGQPVRLGKYHAGATEEDKKTLMRAVASIGTDYAAIVPEAMSMEIIGSDVTGNHELYEKRADWLDRQISKLVLGQTGTTDAIAGGYAVGKVHDGVRADIEDADADQLATTLMRDLARPLVDLNYGPQKKYPLIRIGRPDEVDVEKLVANVAKLVPLGLKVGMTTMRDRIGLPDPDPDEELLGMVSPTSLPPALSSSDVPDRKQQAAGRGSSLPAGAEPGGPPMRPDGPAAPADGKTALQAQGQTVDAIARTAADVSGDVWEPVVAPIVAGLEKELAGAQSLDEARAILDRHRASLDVSRLTEMLARLAFRARLAGEVDEDIAP